MIKKNINVYRRYALAGATFSVAISIGFLMQSSEPGYAGHSPATPSALPVPDGVVKASLSPTQPRNLSDSDRLAALPIPPQDMTPKAELPTEPVILLVSKDMPVGALPQEEDTPLLNCDAELKATPAAAAMVDLTLSAPCLTGERVTIHHNGLKFTEIVGDDGALHLTVPALVEQAMFVVAFTNGDGAVARTEVSSLAFYDRVAVQWTGDSGLQLHAREYGADYGTDGHVWWGHPRDITAIVDGQGGFMTRLGNAALPEASMVEVYTFPSGTSQTEGSIVISLEAEVTETNCSNPVAAKTFEILDSGELRVQEISMSLPDCDATGEFLVLKNLLEDLTIALN